MRHKLQLPIYILVTSNKTPRAGNHTVVKWYAGNTRELKILKIHNSTYRELEIDREHQEPSSDQTQFLSLLKEISNPKILFQDLISRKNNQDSAISKLIKWSTRSNSSNKKRTINLSLSIPDPARKKKEKQHTSGTGEKYE